MTHSQSLASPKPTIWFWKNRFAALFLALNSLMVPKAFTSEVPAYQPVTQVNAAYLGAIVYPGFRLGVERPYRYVQVDKIKHGSIKSMLRQRYLNLSLGMFHHLTFQNHWMLQAEKVNRRQKQGGYFIQYHFGAGVSRAFAAGPDYEVQDDGSIHKVPLAGNWYAMVSLGAGIGYNFLMKKQKPVSVFLKQNWQFFFPYNAFLLPMPTIEIGLNWRCPLLWKSNPKLTYKRKLNRNK